MYILKAIGGDLGPNGVRSTATTIEIKPSQKKYVEEYLRMQEEIDNDFKQGQLPDLKKWTKFEDLTQKTIRALDQTKLFARTKWELVKV